MKVYVFSQFDHDLTSFAVTGMILFMQKQSLQICGCFQLSCIDIDQKH
jgi:hypothetical protein